MAHRSPLRNRSDRWLSAIEGRLIALHAAPKALQLETKRLEKEISIALGELREVFSERPQDARRFLETLLDGSLTFTPVETWKGRRYRIEGHASLELVRLPQTLIVASPEGLGDQGAANVLEFPVFFVAGLQKTGTLAWTP
jgi:hypothetical protein